APAAPHLVWPHAALRDRKRRGRPEKHAAAPLVPQPAITGNGFGGAIFNTATLTITTSTFTKNSAGFGSGGAIYNAAGATLNVSGSVFSLNQAALGGAINNAGNALVNGDSFKSNTGSLVGGFGYGGAIYISGNTTITSSTFASNSVGGAVNASYGAGGAIAQYAGVTSVSGSTFTANVAGGGQNGSWGTGGAIYTTAGSMALSANTFSANRAGGDASGYGGAVYADHAFSGTKNVFSQNVAYATGASNGAYGGAVYAGAGLSLNGDSFSTNSAVGGSSAKPGVVAGGAIDSESTATLISLKLTSNVASGGLGGAAQGGAVYLGGGSSTWTALTATGNSANATGSGSFAAGGAIVALAPLSVVGASALSSNTASSSTTVAIGGIGGAFAVEVGPFSFTGTASGNSATTEGGGFWIGDVAQITNSLVSANRVAAVQAPNDGGAGVYVALGGALTLKGSTLSTNSTHGSVAFTGGGGLFNGGSVTIANDTIAGNTSSEDGGGLENDAAAGFSVTNATIYQNAAAGAGGNVKNLDPDSVMAVANTIIAAGTGGSGADDVSNDGTITSGDYNLVQAPVTGTAMNGTTTHNLSGVSPQLSALANNGGPTPTNADATTSPGTAYIPYSVCSAASITVDQRGDPRNPTGSGHCDIGAYENQHP
ncbi:MAG TPA: choice-of-anchor Q domain-containing protein, partial [Candidatus Acidoferrales bacterium]|nr:choice-of-anchor Q domain-containing protein [Candidatus Acidoferrales bacterium]